MRKTEKTVQNHASIAVVSEHFFKISPKRRQFVRKKKTDDTRWRGNHRLPASKTPCTLRGATTEWLSCLNLYRHPSWCRCCSRSLIINFVNSFPCLFVKQLWIVDNDYWEEFMHARVWVKKERKRRRVFFFLNIICGARMQREKKTMRARTCSVCKCCCAECININDVFSRKDGSECTFWNRLFETTEESWLFFSGVLFHHKTSFHLHLSFSKRRDERKIFVRVEFAKIKKTCRCLDRGGGGKRERKTYIKQHKTEGREKEKRKEKLCVFNVGAGLALRRWWTP